MKKLAHISKLSGVRLSQQKKENSRQNFIKKNCQTFAWADFLEISQNRLTEANYKRQTRGKFRQILKKKAWEKLRRHFSLTKIHVAHRAWKTHKHSLSLSHTQTLATLSMLRFNVLRFSGFSLADCRMIRFSFSLCCELSWGWLNTSKNWRIFHPLERHFLKELNQI